MGVLRLHSTRAQPWSTRSLAAFWKAFDVQLLLYAALLALIGLTMAYTNSEGPAPLAAGTTFSRGLIWLGVAAVAFVVTAAVDYRWLRTFAWPLYVFNLVLLGASLVLGSGVGGVARWVSIFGLQFQFSELAKILTIVALAHLLANRQGHLDRPSTILAAGLVVGPALALVMLQPDLGTSLVFGAVLLGTLFMAGVSLRWMAVLVAALIASVPFAWSYLLRDYQKQRLISFLDPTADPQGSGFHLIQSQSAVRSGGLFGKGLTTGSQGQLDALPVQSTDFAFATLAQQLGFVGGVVVFCLFAALLWRVLMAGWRSEDAFGLVFAAGMATMLLFQLLVNVGMVIGIMPITGIPLPFITHGGASLVSIAIGLGILESINLRQARPDW